jgi:hypothetical protein
LCPYKWFGSGIEQFIVRLWLVTDCLLSPRREAAGSGKNVEGVSKLSSSNGGKSTEEQPVSDKENKSEEQTTCSSSSLVPKVVVFGGSGYEQACSLFNF